jgi:hypothetical protein
VGKTEATPITYAKGGIMTTNSNPPAPKRKPKRWPWVVGVTVFVLFLIGKCGHPHDTHDTSQSSAPSSSSAPSTSAADSSTTSAPPPIDPSNPPVISKERADTDLHAAWTKDPDGTEHVTVMEDSGEGDAKTDTVAILKVAKASFPDATAVAITFKGSSCDHYGNCSDADVLDLVYNQDTMSKFNFNGDYFSRFSTQGEANKNRIWALADSCEPHVGNWQCERL